MPTLFHLSDLHFGPSFSQHLADLVLQDIKSARPDAVIVSGDWTMRGRRGEYEQARDYFRKIPPPVFTIPGNHDQPLHLGGIADRLVRPWARFSNYIQADTDTVFQSPGLFIIGLNDNHNLIPGGIWSSKQRRWMERELKAAPSSSYKILVMHHHLLWEGKWRPAGQWFPGRTLARLKSLGVELVLNGHTHVPIIRQMPEGVIIAQSGTTLSGRTRDGHGNNYNRIIVDADSVHITIHHYDPAADRFAPVSSETFPRRGVSP